LRWVSYRAKQRELLLNRRCARLMVYSDYLRHELVANGFPVEKIECCAPIRRLDDKVRIGSCGNQNLILFAGQVIRGKGVDVLLECLAKVKSDFRCIILGDGNHRAHCERLRAKLRLDGQVQFYGYVPPGKLEEFYLQASVFVMSSLWPEPFGMAGPEAMRYGLPVVAFDAGGIKEWLKDGENGYLVPWKNTDLFAARLDALLRDNELRCKLGRWALETVKRYDSRWQVDYLECVFRSVLREAQSLGRLRTVEMQDSPVSPHEKGLTAPLPGKSQGHSGEPAYRRSLKP
jgi:glycosyltransferase involved in cell wall biosynthesis